MNYAISTTKLTKRYAKVVGINNLDLEVKVGEIFGFIGPNGAGKTTTIRLLLDLIRPTSGQAKIFGLDINQDSEIITEMVGYLPGEVNLMEHLTGTELINYIAGFKEVDIAYQKKLIKLLDLDVKKRISNYSKGNKQKLAVVLALMHRPKLVILDEPTSGLDPVNQQAFYDILRDLKNQGTTVFLSTHILSETEKVCDRVGIIKDGHLIKIENIDQFREKNIRQVFVESKSTISIGGLTKFGVKRVERKSGGFELTVSGKIGPLIKALAKEPIIDIKIYEPSLEEIFFHYYEKNS